MFNNPKIVAATMRVIELLVAGDYQLVANLTKGTRLTTEDIGQAIRRYGRTLVNSPEEQSSMMDVVEIRDSERRRWSIRVPLWTKEEGRSDLTLELTAIEGDDLIELELDDIHVL